MSVEARTYMLVCKPGRQTLAVVPDSIEGWKTHVSRAVIEREPVLDLLQRWREGYLNVTEDSEVVARTHDLLRENGRAK